MRPVSLLLLATLAAHAQEPQIRFAVNAASFAQPDAANGKVARGSLVAITGQFLSQAELQRAPGFPLPMELGGTSVEITAGGSTYNAPIESVFSTHVNIILPSAAPAGPATVKLTAGAASSQPFPVIIAERSVGIFTLSGIGRGTAILTRQENARPADAANSILNSARPGEVWGGVGDGPRPGRLKRCRSAFGRRFESAR